jgi:hypothetical protein
MLPLIQVLLIQEVLEVVVIYPYDEFFPNQILPKLSQCMHDGYNLFVIDGVEELNTSQFSAFINNRVPILHKPQCLPLRHHTLL